nr:heme lyase NrfEFG subunit NrfF [Necropsobacter massiliensis]
MKRYVLLILLALSVGLRAEMVDTYQFKNNEDRLRAVALAKSLRCPQCQNQNLVESNSPIAYDLRLEVYRMVDEGRSNQQIVAQMTERFGDFVRYNPPFKWTTALLWGLPFVLLLAGAVAIWRYTARRGMKARQAPLDEAQRQALQRLLQQRNDE